MMRRMSWLFVPVLVVNAGASRHTVRTEKLGPPLSITICQRAIEVARVSHLVLWIDRAKDGMVTQFTLRRPASSTLEKDAAFRQAVRSLRFKTVYYDGKPVEVESLLSVNCDLGPGNE